MDWKIELIHVPVTDVDRAKDFYVNKLGFNADHDRTVYEGLRFVQLTPPGSACSIAIGEGLGATLEPGTLDVIQVVSPTPTPCSPSSAPRASRPRASTSRTGAGSSRCSDPDGNRWTLQELPDYSAQAAE